MNATRKKMHRSVGNGLLGILVSALAAVGAARANGPEAHNMRLVGLHDLQGRGSYQPVVHRYGDRWILFAGHHAGSILNPLTGKVERNGVSILDVTDPAEPRLLHHLPPTGEANGTQHVQVCSGSVLPNADSDKTYLLRSDRTQRHEMYDVTDPAAPVFLTTVLRPGLTDDGEQETHKNWWDCETGIGYLNATADGWRVTRVLQAFDLTNPSAPRHIRDFALIGWQPSAEGPDPETSGLHQVVVSGNRIYVGYGSGEQGVLQILDRDKFLQGDPASSDPFAPTPENLLYPQISRLDLPSYWGVHTAKPVYDIEIADYADSRDNRVRDFLIVVSEAGRSGYQCQETRDVSFMIDITEEDKPFPVASFQVPEEPGDFCNRGGRFGPHAPHDAFHPAFDKTIVLVSYFNAGVRAFDIRDPFHPEEVGYFIPETTELTEELCANVGGVESCKVAIQTNNVNIDDRGYIYMLDRHGTGLHIVALTGPARAIVGLP